ncbi:MAG: hypothetical protein ACO3MB_07335 [Saprospiraceae bacterium]
MAPTILACVKADICSRARKMIRMYSVLPIYLNGALTMSTSRSVAPPTAVVIPMMIDPTRSNFLSIAVSTQMMANTEVPARSS